MTGILEGKVAMVTGAASGIGRASAIALAREGACVVAADISADEGEATVKTILDAGGQAKFIRTDVTCAADLQAAVEYAVSHYGRLDIAHNNAGILANSSLLADDAEQVFDRVMSVNGKSVMLSMKCEIPQMLKQGGGAIINTSSTMGLVATGPGFWAYTASKHAIVGLTRAIATEYASRGIRINAVCPGGVHTPMAAALMSDPEMIKAANAAIPLGRAAQAEEIAAAVLWLASDAASYMVGVALPVDGGYTAV